MISWLQTTELVTSTQSIAINFMTKLNNIITVVKTNQASIKAMSTVEGLVISSSGTTITVSSYTRYYLDGSTQLIPETQFSNLNAGSLYYIYQTPSGQVKVTTKEVRTSVSQYFLGTKQL